MFYKKILSVAAVVTALAGSASAAIVDVDLSGATTGGIVNGLGASFGASFSGQTVLGNVVSGSPSAPLTLQAADSITVAFFNPGVSTASNSLLSQDNNFLNGGALSGLLDTAATTLSFTAGFFNGGGFDILFYGADGSLVSTQSASQASGYHVLNFNVGSAFLGFSISNNTDPAGLRFQNFSYETAAIPLPAAGFLLIAALGGMAAVGRRRSAG